MQNSELEKTQPLLKSQILFYFEKLEGISIIKAVVIGFALGLFAFGMMLILLLIFAKH